MEPNRIIILSGPSGAGKGAAGKHVLTTHPELMLSVSVATRGPRPGEKDGVHYHFWERQVQRFMEAVDRHEFLEWEQVYANDEGYRGTLASEIPRIWGLGRTPLLDIDVEGAIKVKQLFPEETLRILLRPASLPQWEQMLRDRNEHDGGDLQKLEDRIRKAPLELQRAEEANFEHVVINNYDASFFEEISDCVYSSLLGLGR